MEIKDYSFNPQTGELIIEEIEIKNKTLQNSKLYKKEKLPTENEILQQKLVRVIFNVAVERINKDLLKGKQSLKEVIFDDSTKIIGRNAFCGCEELTNINFPKSLVIIENEAFYKSGVQNLVFNNDLVSIGEKSFSETKLKNVVLPNSIEFLGDGAFEGCEELEKITLPSKLTTISKSLLKDCKKLKEIVIPDGVTTIQDKAFCGCEKLEKVSLPDKLTFVGKKVFAGCKNLKCLSFPKHIVEIDEKAFFDCTKLEEAYISTDSDELEKLIEMLDKCNLRFLKIFFDVKPCDKILELSQNLFPDAKISFRFSSQEEKDYFYNGKSIAEYAKKIYEKRFKNKDKEKIN